MECLASPISIPGPHDNDNSLLQLLEGTSFVFAYAFNSRPMKKSAVVITYVKVYIVIIGHQNPIKQCGVC